jgi:hypothetical protein
MYVEEFKTARDLVYFLLKNYVETRKSDKILFLKACELYGANTLDDIRSLPISYETLSRVRRIIQNEENKYKPPINIKVERNNSEKAFRKFFKYNKIKEKAL